MGWVLRRQKWVNLRPCPSLLTHLTLSPIQSDTYRNSYTWFEASILRPPTSTSPSVFQEPPEWITSTALYGPTNITSRVGSDSGWVELSSPYRTKSRRWLVQMNAQASHHIRHHEVVWSSTDASTTAALRSGNVGGAEYDEKTGSGRGLGFVDNLQSGDRIALIARALVSVTSSDPVILRDFNDSCSTLAGKTTYMARR